MKVLHVPYCYYPDAVGGTEVYVTALAHELQRRGHQMVIAAPAAQPQDGVYENIPVRRFAVTAGLQSLNALYGAGDVAAAQNFDQLLFNERPDVVHLHALTSAVSSRLAARVRRRGIPLVFTYHTPTVSCPRGNLLRFGVDSCDGQLSERHCTACVLQNLGLPRWAGEAVRYVPARVRQRLAVGDRAGDFRTALRMPALLERRAGALRYFLARVDRVVAVSAWVRELLLRNGVPAAKIVLCRHGISSANTARPALSALPLKFLFAGRFEPAKGLALLLRVLRQHPSWDVALDIFGGPVAGLEAYAQQLYAAAAGDSRVHFVGSVAHSQLVARMADYHSVLVPSQGLETGPLVMLEAFAAGVPVIGSRLGGIAEWVRDDESGRLVEAGSLSAWSEALGRVIRDPSALERWRQQLPAPRLMSQVAGEMEQLYLDLRGGVRG